MPKTTEQWLLFKYIDGEFTPLSKPFKSKEPQRNRGDHHNLGQNRCGPNRRFDGVGKTDADVDAGEKIQARLFVRKQPLPRIRACYGRIISQTVG